MSTAGVTYKTLAPGCTVVVRPFVPPPGQERAIQSIRRRAKASAGLTVETGVAFPVGSLVVLDLTFPGQTHTYRSRGMVSWVTPSQRSDGLFNIGVLVFGMDKLDSAGINLSRAPQLLSYSLMPDNPAQVSEAPEPPPAPVEPLGRPLRDSEPAPSWGKVVDDKHRSPPRMSLAPASDAARGALVSMCTVDPKIARWMGSAAERPVRDEPREREPSLHQLRAALEAEGKAAPTRPPASPYESPTPPLATRPSEPPLPRIQAGRIVPARPQAPRPSTVPPKTTVLQPTKDISPVYRAPAIPSTPDPLASTIIAAPRASRPPRSAGRRPSEIPVLVDERSSELSTEAVGEYDAEEKTIEAFERIHGLYNCEDKESAARFVLGLARDLVRCDAAVCWLVAEKTPRLEVVAAQGSIIAHLEGARLELGAGLAGKSVREGRLIRSTDRADLSTFDVPPYGPVGLRGSVKNVLVAPVMRDGHTVGAIELLSSPRAEGFALGEANVLSYLCVALAEHLDTALPTREEA